MTKFKVGDRVRFQNHPYWLVANQEAGVVTGKAAGGYRGDWLVKVDNYSGADLAFFNREIELVEDTWDFDQRKLKIEAGKFYKTHDGRKVGPIVAIVDDGDGFVWESSDCYYIASGVARHLSDSNDLVAEWTTSCAAAQVDNQRDEYGPVVKAGNDNGKPKFKVGDRVRVTRHCNFRGDDIRMGLPVGEVRRIGLQTAHLAKEGVDTFVLEGDDRHFYTALNFELVTTTPAIVALIEDGQPKPADQPHVHPSRGHAGDEAARLARKYPGKEFGVYELVDTRQVAAKVYDHEWQRLAASGLDESAASELAELTGLPWEVAHQAVLKAA